MVTFIYKLILNFRIPYVVCLYTHSSPPGAPAGSTTTRPTGRGRARPRRLSYSSNQQQQDDAQPDAARASVPSVQTNDGGSSRRSSGRPSRFGLSLTIEYSPNRGGFVGRGVTGDGHICHLPNCPDDPIAPYVKRDGL